MRRIKIESRLPGLVLAAFHDGKTGQLSVVGRNSAAKSQVLNVRISNVAGFTDPTLAVHLTSQSQSQSKSFEKQASAVLSGDAFSVTVPADTFFLVRN